MTLCVAGVLSRTRDAATRIRQLVPMDVDVTTEIVKAMAELGAHGLIRQARGRVILLDLDRLAILSRRMS